MSPAAPPATQVRVLAAGSAEVTRAAAALRAARRVLVTGLHDVSADAVTAACDVAEALGAVIDTGTADRASPLGPVVARAGGITAAPEELRDRADLVVEWFCDPETWSPGFRKAFLAPPLAGGQPRQVLAVGPEPVAAPTRHLPLPRESAVDLARLVHALLLDHAPPRENETAARLVGVCHELVAAIQAAACVGFVSNRAADPLGLTTWSTRLLVRVIAHGRPAFEVPLDEPACGGGGPGAADVLTWRYGAAGGIARADRLGASFRPGECAAETLISRGEVDAVLAMGRLPAAVEAAVSAHAGQLVVVRIDEHDTAAATIAALLEALRQQPASGASP